MKGFAGIVYPDVFQVNQTVTSMLQCLQRSPEEKYGTHVFKNMEIGSCGSPMFCNTKKSVYIALSGFLDDTEELCKELKREGFHFTGRSSEEIIVHAYECWGKNFLKKIKGSFSLVLLDQTKETLLLARDSTGKKPLYWYQDQKHFLFSNQLKSLLATGLVPQTPAPDALAAYLYFGYCPQDMTPIKGISKLLPGYYLEFRADGSKNVQPYWSYSSFFEKRISASHETIVKELDVLLKNAVEAHVTKEDPISCFISGGLGSASVAYYLRRTCTQGQVKAYSVGFQGENEEDVLAATEVAEEFNIPQRRLLLTPQNFLDDFVRITWNLDEPLADLNVIATWNLAKLASEQSNFVYSGMGSDELFAGHNRYTKAERGRPLHSNLGRMLLPSIAQWFAPVLNLVYSPAAYALLRRVRADSWHIDYLRHNALFNEQTMSSAAPKLAGLFSPELFMNKFYNMPRIKSSTSAFLYFDVKTRMADMYIMQYEKLTSAFDLLWYSPFLNRDVIEYAASLPEPEELTETQSALYLKSILKNLLPDSVINRPKKSRPHFLASWLDQSELPALFNLLLSGTLVEEGYISEDWLRHQLSDKNKMYESFHQLWAILTLEVWFRIYINRSIQEAPPEISLRDLLEED